MRKKKAKIVKIVLFSNKDSGCSKNQNIFQDYSKNRKTKRKTTSKPIGFKAEENEKIENKIIISSIDDNNNNQDSNSMRNNKRRNSNNDKNNTIPGLKEKKKPKSNITKKYNNYNYYNNYNFYDNFNFNNYNSNIIPDENKQIAKIKRDTKINSLIDLFNKISEEKKEKSEKSRKEKSIDKKDENFDFPYNMINNNKEEMNPLFLNDDKRNNAFNIEKELYKSSKKDNVNNNNEINNISKIEIDCSNSIFNCDGIFFNKNDQMNSSKINFNDEIIDIEEGEEIRNYFNKSLIDKIENPFFGEDKNDQLENLYNKDKSKFFNYDFFDDNNKED